MAPIFMTSSNVRKESSDLHMRDEARKKSERMAITNVSCGLGTVRPRCDRGAVPNPILLRHSKMTIGGNEHAQCIAVGGRVENLTTILGSCSSHLARVGERRERMAFGREWNRTPTEPNQEKCLPSANGGFSNLRSYFVHLTQASLHQTLGGTLDRAVERRLLLNLARSKAQTVLK